MVERMSSSNNINQRYYKENDVIILSVDFDIFDLNEARGNAGECKQYLS